MLCRPIPTPLRVLIRVHPCSSAAISSCSPTPFTRDLSNRINMLHRLARPPLGIIGTEPRFLSVAPLVFPMSEPMKIDAIDPEAHQLRRNRRRQGQSGWVLGASRHIREQRPGTGHTQRNVKLRNEPSPKIGHSQVRHMRRFSEQPSPISGHPSFPAP